MKNQVLFPWLLFSLILLLSSSITGQTSADLSWWKPSNATFPVIDGGGWSAELKDTIQRLPGRAKSLVRPPVWNLSLQPAGLFIRFFSNAHKSRCVIKLSAARACPTCPLPG
nr:SGNH/GDSL hydrolase N-terminal domain-containing protein [Haliscomenobacter sp.]